MLDLLVTYCNGDLMVFLFNGALSEFKGDLSGFNMI